ncbi:MAG: type II toxin-antitoxin system RelE/ParE family toxin [Planctomycetota bacterium]
MTRKLVVSRPAESDLDEESEYLGRDDPALAERFLAAARATFADLAATPGLGRSRGFRAARLRGLRSWRIRGFENWLVFYRVADETVEIVRVLHGARDLDAAFDQDGDV